MAQMFEESRNLHDHTSRKRGPQKVCRYNPITMQVSKARADQTVLKPHSQAQNFKKVEHHHPNISSLPPDIRESEKMLSVQRWIDSCPTNLQPWIQLTFDRVHTLNSSDYPFIPHSYNRCPYQRECYDCHMRKALGVTDDCGTDEEQSSSIENQFMLPPGENITAQRSYDQSLGAQVNRTSGQPVGTTNTSQTATPILYPMTHPHPHHHHHGNGPVNQATFPPQPMRLHHMQKIENNSGVDYNESGNNAAYGINKPMLMPMHEQSSNEPVNNANKGAYGDTHVFPNSNNADNGNPSNMQSGYGFDSSRFYSDKEVQIIVKFFRDYFEKGSLPSVQEVRKRLSKTNLVVKRTAVSVRMKMKRLQTTGRWTEYINM